MEDIEIEYLDEYKDLVLPGIKTNSDRSAATGAISYQVPLPRRRRISSDSSGSSSIDPDIFQKLFDGKLLEDEMLTESGSNAKGRNRCRLSSSSSDSNDALDALYNRQVSKRRDRLNPYVSIDDMGGISFMANPFVPIYDLGDELVGATHKTLARTANSQSAKKSLSDGLQLGRGGGIVAKSKSAESRPQANKSNLTVASIKPNSKTDSLKLGLRTSGTSSSSCSSNAHLQANRKKAITIIKAQKPDLKPPKHEPKEDPLLLAFCDDSDSDLSYEYESDFYGYGDSEDEDGVGSNQIIDISTDSNTATSLAHTVTPVVSEDESQQQLEQQQMPHAATERLQLYLNNLSGAESPPSKYKYTRNCKARKSRSNEKPSSTSTPTPTEQPTASVNDNNDVVDQALPMAEEPQRDGLSSSSTDSDKMSRADHVDDDNLTYETLERLSQNLAAEIIKIDAERSIEFEKRSGSGSKQRSISPSKLFANSTLYANHVRKLTYSNEKVDEVAPMRRTKSDETFPKRGRCGRQSKSRAATTEEQSKYNPLSPTKITAAETPSTTTTVNEKDSPNKEPSLNTKSPAIPETIKRKRGRPRKNKLPSANASSMENQTEKPSVILPDNENSTVVSVVDDSNSKKTFDELDIKIETTKNENRIEFNFLGGAATEEPVISELFKDILIDSRELDTKDTVKAERELKSAAAASEQQDTLRDLCGEEATLQQQSSIDKLCPTIETNSQILNVKNVVERCLAENRVAECLIDTSAVKCVKSEGTESTILITAVGKVTDRNLDIYQVDRDVKASEQKPEANNGNLSETIDVADESNINQAKENQIENNQHFFLERELNRRSTRYRKQTPIVLPTRRTRSRYNKSKEQHKSADETESTPKSKKIKKPKSESDQNVNDTPIPDSIDQSETVKTAAKETTHRSARKRITSEPKQSSQAAENQFISDSDVIQLALDPDTPSTCSSGGSCRKLRVLLKRVEQKSESILCHKFENDVENVTPTDQPTAANKEPTDHVVENPAGKDESSENIDPFKTMEKSTDQSPFESQPKQSIVDQPKLSKDEYETVIEEQKPVEEDAEKDLPQYKTENEEKQQAEPAEVTEINVHQIEMESKEQKPIEKTSDEQPIDAEIKYQQAKLIETEAKEQPEPDEKEDAPEQDQQPKETKESAADIDQQLIDEKDSVTKDKQPIETDSQPDQAAGSEEPLTDNITTQLNPTETTGVLRSVDGISTVEGCINSVSSEAEADVDATQPDDAVKSTLPAKEGNARKSNTMAPPAPPKRELSTGKAVLRRMGKPTPMDVQPSTKRRKLVDTIVFYDDSKDNKETTKEPTTPLKTIDEVPAAKAVPSKKQLSATPKLLTVLGRKSELPKASTVKSSLSTLLSPDRPVAVDNSVIITTTAVTNPTVEPFKKVESSTIGSGINISVSLVPDAVLPQPKKKLTQAETVKTLISVKASRSKKTGASPAAAVATIRPVAKCLPAAADTPADGSKTKPRKSLPVTKIIGKAAASVSTGQPAKKSLPKKETSKKLITKAEAAATSSSLATKKSEPANLLEAANATATTAKTSNNINQPIEAAAASPNKKHAVRKVANKTLGKLKSNETLQSGAAAAPQVEPIAVTPANPPDATQDSSSTRDTKRAARIAKPSLATPPVKRGGSHTRSTAGTPTPTQQQQQQESVSNEQQQQLALLLPLAIQQQPKQQRQARKLLKINQTKEKAQCQAEAATAPPAPAPPSPPALPPTPAPDPNPAPAPAAAAAAAAAAQLPQQQQVKQLPSRKRKVPAKFDVNSAGVKRLKETPAAKPETTSIAFPVLITAATVVLPEISSPAAVAVAATPTETSTQQRVPPVKHPTTNKLHPAPQLLPPKLRKLRVRLNRNCLKNWLKAQQHQFAEQPLPTDQVELDPPAEPIPNMPLIAIQQLLPRFSAIKSVPLPVPLPSLEVKSEQDVDEPQPKQMVVDVPLVATRTRAEKAQLTSSTTHSLMAAAATTTDNCMQRTRSISNTISTTINTTMTSTTTGSNSAIQSDSSGGVSDSFTFGTTKMFTYLYPKRSQCSFGHVALDYCCHNLDGPIRAIDPTRMHEKVEVPVLELPQCMVITSKIISKQDKNIPQKVLAKLEQLAAKDGLPKVLQTVTMTTTATPPIPAAVHAPLAAVASPQRTTANNLDRLPKQLTTGAILTKKQHPPNVDTPVPAKALQVISSPTVTSSLIPRLLHLPPICPSDKQRLELQTRVQLFDAVLQSLSRRAAAMNVSERQLIIEMIVKTSTLLPIDVDVGTKLLENYVYYLNAVTNTTPRPQLRSIVTPAPATSTTSSASTPLSSSKLVQSKSLSRNLTTPAIMRPTSSSSTAEPRRPIYDKQRNIIGYQYRTNQSSPLRTAAGSSSLRSSSLPAGTPIATVAAQQQLQRTRFLMMPSASSKIAVVNSVAQSTVALATQRVGSGNIIPVYPSRNSKGLPQKAAAIISADKATPVGVVNGVPILGTSASASTATNSSSNRNVFIVNHLLSQPEECILPDAIGGTIAVAAAEIKDELDDAEILN